MHAFLKQVRSRFSRLLAPRRASPCRKKSLSLTLLPLEDRELLAVDFPAIALGITGSTESYSRTVTDFYQQHLLRGPDVPGLRFWAGHLQTGQLTHEQLRAIILSSAEYVAKHGSRCSALEAIYREVLGRDADGTGREFWCRAVESGVPMLDAALGIVGSDESRQLRITEYYWNYLGRNPGREEVLAWSSLLGQGVNHQRIQAGFLSSREYVANVSVEDPILWLTNAYQDVLRRSPEIPAYQFWVGQDVGEGYRSPLPRRNIIWVDNPIWESSGELTYVKVAYGKPHHFADARDGGSHRAVDIKAPVGTLVRPITAGTVSPEIVPFSNGSSSCGNRVELEHRDGLTGSTYVSVYCHVVPDAGLRPGMTVRADQVLGKVDLSGNPPEGTEPHLHLAVFSLSTGISPPFYYPKPLIHPGRDWRPPAEPPPLENPLLGTYRGSFSGSVVGQPIEGPVAFAVDQNGVVRVTEPVSVNGRVRDDGQLEPIEGCSSVQGVQVCFRIVGAFRIEGGIASASGSWTGDAPGFGSGSGTWSARRS